MNATARSLLQTVLSIDAGLDHFERAAVQRLLEGRREGASAGSGESGLLLTQKEAAQRLSVSRVTVWRLVREGHLVPVELPNGMVRYSSRQLAALADAGLAKISRGSRAA